MLAALLLPAVFFAECARAGADPDEVRLKFVATGAMPHLGAYVPIGIVLSGAKPAGVSRLPRGLVAPLYGTLKLGPAESQTSFYVIVDEPPGKPPLLFVDANGNGDFADDPPPDWDPQRSESPDGKRLFMHMGGARLRVPFGQETLVLHVPMYRLDKPDPLHPTLTNLLFCYSDYARMGEVTLGGDTYDALLADQGVTGDFRSRTNRTRPGATLFLDLNHDGKFDLRREGFPIDQPFNVGGVSYQVTGMTPSGDVFRIVQSSRMVAETKPMADLSPGHPALEFTARATDGATVNFPQSYAGKVVLLDFWASSDGNSAAELPNIIAAYEKYHARGFEVLGVSLDPPDSAVKLDAFVKGRSVPWRQVYDGRGWQAAVALQYNISSIPFAFLIDGDTGAILEEGDDIRAELLAPSIEHALDLKAKAAGR